MVVLKRSGLGFWEGKPSRSIVREAVRRCGRATASPAVIPNCARSVQSSDARVARKTHLLLLLLLFRVALAEGCPTQARDDLCQRHVERRQLLLPGRRRQPVQRARLHADQDRLARPATVDALV